MRKATSLISAFVFAALAVVLYQNFDVVPNLARRMELPLGLKAADLRLPADEKMDPALIDVGHLLFFDRRISKGSQISCSSCHDSGKAYTDLRAISKGIDGRVITNNSPAAFNRMFSIAQGWSGQSKDLIAQAIGPITNPDEMGLTEAQLVQAVNAIPGYRDRFERLVRTGTLKAPAVSALNISRALATYQRTLMSGGSRFDRYIAGDTTAMNAAQLRGMALFNGKAQCLTCHSGANFTNESFHRLGLNVLRAKFSKSQGHRRMTKNDEDFGKFKTPTLRNVAQTAPYFHDGSAATLAAVVDAYNEGGFSITHPVANALPRTLQPDPLITKLNLSTQEKSDLVAFLQALTGDLPAQNSLGATGLPNSTASRENIMTSPDIFNLADYRRFNPSIASQTDAQLLQHWSTTGATAGLQASLTFSAPEYLDLYPDLHASMNSHGDRYIRAMVHYLEYGRREGRVGRWALDPRFFDITAYRSFNAEAKYLFQPQAIAHMLTSGQDKKLRTHRAPYGYFAMGSAQYFANGKTYCKFASQADFLSRSKKKNLLGVPKLGYLPVGLSNAGACSAHEGPVWAKGDAFDVKLLPAKYASQMLTTIVAQRKYLSMTSTRALAISASGHGMMSAFTGGVQSQINVAAQQACFVISGGQPCALLAIGDKFAVSSEDLPKMFTYKVEKPTKVSATTIPMVPPQVAKNASDWYATAVKPKALVISLTGAWYGASSPGAVKHANAAAAAKHAMERCELSSALSPCIIFAQDDTVMFNPVAINRSPALNYAQTAVPKNLPSISPLVMDGRRFTEEYLNKVNGTTLHGAVFISGNGAFGWATNSNANSAVASAKSVCERHLEAGETCFRYATNKTVLPLVNNLHARTEASRSVVHCKVVPRLNCAAHKTMGCGAGPAYTTHSGKVVLETCP